LGVIKWKNNGKFRWKSKSKQGSLECLNFIIWLLLIDYFKEKRPKKLRFVEKLGLVIA